MGRARPRRLGTSPPSASASIAAGGADSGHLLRGPPFSNLGAAHSTMGSRGALSSGRHWRVVHDIIVRVEPAACDGSPIAGPRLWQLARRSYSRRTSLSKWGLRTRTWTNIERSLRHGAARRTKPWHFQAFAATRFAVDPSCPEVAKISCFRTNEGVGCSPDASCHRFAEHICFLEPFFSLWFPPACSSF